jgi:AraC-like DNA-binding protein
MVAARPFELDRRTRCGVDSSPYHLLRLFRAETGSTIHQYRMQLRLTAAARAILDGCDDNRTALDLGFSSHSHLHRRLPPPLCMAPSSLRARTPRPAGNSSHSTAPVRPIR